MGKIALLITELLSIAVSIACIIFMVYIMYYDKEEDEEVTEEEKRVDAMLLSSKKAFERAKTKSYQEDMHNIKQNIIEAIQRWSTSITITVNALTIEEIVKTLEEHGYKVSVSNHTVYTKIIRISWGKDEK